MATASSAAFWAPAFPIAKRAHRHAARHLHDRQQRIHALQRLALDRHAEHGHSVFAATIPGRCAAPPAPAMITCKPARLGARRIFHHPLRRAVRRDDLRFVRYVEERQHLGRMAHGLPVGLTAHDDADQRLGHARLLSLRLFADLDDFRLDVRSGLFDDLERGRHNFGADSVAVHDGNRGYVGHMRIPKYHAGVAAVRPGKRYHPGETDGYANAVGAKRTHGPGEGMTLGRNYASATSSTDFASVTLSP